MRDHAEIGNAVWWPAGWWMWEVWGILTMSDGRRQLMLRRWNGQAEIVTRFVPETDVESNAFRLPA